MGVELKESGFRGTLADVQRQQEETTREPARAILSQQKVPRLRTQGRRAYRGSQPKRAPLPMQKVFSHLQRHQGHRALPDAQAKGTRTHGGDAFGLWLSSSGDRGGLLPRRADGGALGEGGRDTLPASSRARGRGRSGRVGAGTSRRVAGEGY